MMEQTPDLDRPLCPTVARPEPAVRSDVDTGVHERSILVERKHITFSLKENSRGRFLRIVEEVSGRRNAIIVPLAGMEDFRDTLNEVIKFSKTLPPKI